MTATRSVPHNQALNLTRCCRVIHAEEPVLVETFLTEPTVE